MPTYEYVCQKCGHEFELFQSMLDKPIKRCPKCKKLAVKRLIGSGAGLIFKGTGFYITDYKNKGSGSDPKQATSMSTGTKPDAAKPAESKPVTAIPPPPMPAASKSRKDSAKK